VLYSHRTTHIKYYARVQNACLPIVCRWGALLKVFISPPISYFEKFKSIHNSKIVKKKLFRNFSNKYENKLDKICGTTEK
jgi:hypothetical protein